MAELAVNIHHFEVHHLDTVFPDHIHNVMCGSCHNNTSQRVFFYYIPGFSLRQSVLLRQKQIFG